MPRNPEIRRRLGDSVRLLRTARGWTQEQLGERAALSYKFVGEIERGQGNPTVDTLARLSAALDVDVAELFGPAPRRAVYEVTTRDMLMVRDALDSASRLLDRFSRAAAPPRKRKA
jgi:transcriptional regulator with XRE-family HTH domain